MIEIYEKIIYTQRQSSIFVNYFLKSNIKKFFISFVFVFFFIFKDLDVFYL
jgi:hypothetical protein